MSTQAATFTIQDFAPDVAKVFDAARRFGSASVRTSGGETFEVTKKPAAKPVVDEVADDIVPDFPARWKRLREMGLIPPPAAENDGINRIIAGEI
ncbi:MAG: hypothetical protein ACKVY0_07875 [Prosthecobacter sp.]|uniref:hypothetical protein n=1 Tax=Prosthecobacter sp. TaxID=1965333 RepID=UPI0039034271